eukprot:5134449-Ditylum_brightwellii.AAC.1
MAKRHRGVQSFWFPNDDEIPIEYDANKYKLYIKCKCPTTRELKTIPIQWVDCHFEDLEMNKGIKPVCQKPWAMQSQLIVPNATEEEPEMILTKKSDAQPKKSILEDCSVQKEKQPDVDKADDATTITKYTPGSDEAFNWKDTQELSRGNCCKDTGKYHSVLSQP